MIRIKKYARWELAAIVCGLVFGQGQLAHAGWTGSMNGTGTGWASVNVTSSKGTTGRTNTPAGTLNPSASMTSTPGYLANAPLPSGSSTGTVARVKGGAGYVWTATTAGSNGDKTDNEEIEGRVNIVPADCAFLTMESSADLASNGVSGTITINATATEGTALLLRGFEYPGELPPPASTEDLVANGSLKWDVLLVGPFELNQANCKALVIPFTIPIGGSNLYFVTDGVAKSKPITLVCPENVAYGCAETVVYPTPQITGGCGDVTFSYDPPAEALPVGVVTTVTITARDESGGSATCTFQADNTAKGIPLVITCPTNVVFGCSDALTYPSATVSGGCGTVTVSYSPPASALPVGVTTVTVTATDSTGTTAQCTFTATRNSFTFCGFEEPLRCSNGGSCDSPARTLNAGCVLPIEFKTKCGNLPYTTGTPTLVITKCPSQPVLTGNFRLDGSEWEYNWNTRNAGKGTFKIDVTLQDGSHQIVYVKLK